MAWMNKGGSYRGPSTVRTSGGNLRREIFDIKAGEKALTSEQVDRILRTVRAVGVTCHDESLTPDEGALPFRSGPGHHSKSCHSKS